MHKTIIIFIMLVCSLSFNSLFLTPKYQSFSILNDMVSAKEVELSFKQDYYSQVRKISNDLEEYSEPLTKIEMALSSEPDIALLFEFLQQTTSHTGLILKETSFSYEDGSKKTENPKNSLVSFKVSGRLENFFDFLVYLEKSARLVEVSSIQFKAPEEGDIFIFNVKAKIHFLD